MIIIDDSFNTIVSESSSKGNQSKFYKNGYWIKLDNRYCSEGLAEEFASLFASCIHNFDYVQYRTEQFLYRDDIYNGCYSYNMYSDLNISFLSLRNIFRSNKISSDIFIKSADVSDNIINVVQTVKQITGVDILQYLFRLLLFDSLIINEDRHWMNLGICYNGKQYGVAPCFDNGSSLFCTNWTYRKRKNFNENITSAKSVAKPFSEFFDRQVEACILLGATPLQIDKRKVNYILSNYSNAIYDGSQVELVKSVLINRLDYYSGKGVYIYV